MAEVAVGYGGTEDKDQKKTGRTQNLVGHRCLLAGQTVRILSVDKNTTETPRKAQLSPSETKVTGLGS